MKLTTMLAMAAAMLAAPAVAQDKAPPPSVQFGAITYSFYCATCHGSDAAGDGGVADYLSVHPLDLTMLAAANNGVFPAERVRAVIDGRDEVVGHLEVAMPPWGRLFAHELRDFEEGSVREAIVARRIDHLVAYIRSIQR